MSLALSRYDKKKIEFHVFAKKNENFVITIFFVFVALFAPETRKIFVYKPETSIGTLIGHVCAIMSRPDEG